MSRPKVFVLNTYHPEALDLLKNAAEVDVVLPGDGSQGRWQDEASAILIRSEAQITSEDLASAKKLKIVTKQGAGVDNVDLAAAKEHGIAVCNTPAINSESVAELTLTLALSIARRVMEVDRRLNRGEELVRSRFLGQSLFHRTLGIVGMGNIGKQIASKWIGAMSGKIITFDPFAPAGAWDDIEHDRVQHLDALLESSDVITLHVPKTKDTLNMISKREFGIMKKNAILVNCARGGLVNEDALLDALNDQQIFGAALDAMDVEPPSLDAYKRHLAHDNLILTPHIGATTDAAQIASGKAAVETVLAILRGESVGNRLV